MGLCLKFAILRLTLEISAEPQAAEDGRLAGTTRRAAGLQCCTAISLSANFVLGSRCCALSPETSGSAYGQNQSSKPIYVFLFIFNISSNCFQCLHYFPLSHNNHLTLFMDSFPPLLPP